MECEVPVRKFRHDNQNCAYGGGLFNFIWGIIRFSVHK